MSDQRSHHREVGHTQDAGWEIGVSRTFARPPAAVWRTLMSDRARRISVRFHHDRLAGPDERVQMREHWRAVIDRLEPLIDGEASEG